MITVPPTFRKILGSDTDKPYPEVETVAVVVLHMEGWTKLDEYQYLRRTYDYILERVWCGLLAAGDLIGEIQVYLYCSEKKTPKLYQWHRDCHVSDWTIDQAQYTMEERADSFFKVIKERYYPRFVYVFITDDPCSEQHPFWTRLCHKEGIIAAHHYRYVQDPKHDEWCPDPELYYCLQRTDDEDVSTALEHTEAKESEEDRAAGFVAFLKGTAEVYKDICKSGK